MKACQFTPPGRLYGDSEDACVQERSAYAGGFNDGYRSGLNDAMDIQTIDGKPYRVAYLIWNTTARLESGNLVDWPKHMQDKVHQKLENLRRRTGVSWTIHATKSDSIPECHFVIVIAVTPLVAN